MRQCLATIVRTACMSVLIAWVFVSATACASRPTLEVRYARVTGVSPMGVTMSVVMRVNNSNSFDVQVRNVRAQVVLAGRHALPPFDYNPNVWLPAGQNTQVSAPVVIPWTMVPQLLAETVGSEDLTYHVQGVADVTASRLLNIQSNNEPIDETGKISRAMLLQAARSMFPGAQ